MNNKNKEGYTDTTSTKAIANMSRDEKSRSGDVSILIKMLKQIISFAGFELVERIIIKDKKTGKEYK